MKIIAYNISVCQQWKIDSLMEHDADIYILPECAKPSTLHVPAGYGTAWEGSSWLHKNQMKSKGLAMIWNRDTWKVPNWYAPELHFAIPITSNDGTIILGLWPTRTKEENHSYTTIAKTIISHYTENLKGHKVLVAGDFNLPASSFADIKPVDSMLKELGLESIYHKTTGEQLGEESQPTYYHQFNEDKPFFIDFAYTNMQIIDYKLLPWNGKFSDHVCQEIIL